MWYNERREGGWFRLFFLRCVSTLARTSFSQQIASSFSLTFFVSKESYKETASLLKKDCCLLPSLNSFFKGDGCSDGSFGIVEKEIRLDLLIIYV
jgi:hypothetical protein